MISTYLPLLLARIDSGGHVTKPAYLEFLTIDNSYGYMPEQCPNEVTPHVLAAMGDNSDEPGAATWLCPFDEYHDAVFGPSPNPELRFGADWFLRGAVNQGFPLNSVISVRNWLRCMEKYPSVFDRTVLVLSGATGQHSLETQLLERAKAGRPLLIYGPLTHASPALLEALKSR